MIKNRALLVSALCLLVCVSAGAAGSKERTAAPQAKAPAVGPAQPAAPAKGQQKKPEPPPPPAFIIAGGIDATRWNNLVVGGYVEATLLRGNLGLSLNGDAVTITLPDGADAKAIGAVGLFSTRYYWRMLPAGGNYFVAVFLGAGSGFGTIGYEAWDSDMSMSYIGLALGVPFLAELGMQVVLGNRLLVQSLIRGGGIYLMGDDMGGVYPCGSICMSVGVFLE